MRVPRRVALPGIACLLALGAAGCSSDAFSFVPNMDHGSSGCANMRGPAAPPRLPEDWELKGRSPAAAGQFAASLGHVVVWNRQTANYGECWCVPPTVGTVTGESFLGANGQLFIVVDAPDVRTSGAEQPSRGWGC